MAVNENSLQKKLKSVNNSHMGVLVKRLFRFLENLDLPAKISLSIFIFLIFYFSYTALTTTPEQINEVDSLFQHIPLSKAISKGNLFHPPDLAKGLGFYMPIGETILALFIKAGIPLGFYNILGVCILYYLAYKLALLIGLDKSSSIIYTTSIIAVKSVVSLIPTQKNDIWVDIFYLLVIYLLFKPLKNIRYFILLGIAAGLLIGVKYSGIFYVVILSFVFARQLIQSFDKPIKLLSFFIPTFLLGFIWYIRNYLIKRNPFYPLNVLGFKGHPEFIIPKGYNTFFNAGSLGINIEAFLSEYLIWALLPILFVVLYFVKRDLLKSVYKYLLIAFSTFLVYLYLPSAFSRTSITSNVRFLHVTFFMMIISSFIIAKFLKIEKLVQFLAITNSLMIFSQFEYRPKLILTWGLFCLILFYINVRKFKKI